MLVVNNINKAYTIEPTLTDISFVVNSGERVALVGPNGCGKTTLLRIIAGDEAPDSGQVATQNGTRIGYLKQGLRPTPGRTVRQEMLAGIDGYEAAHAALEQAADALADPPDGDMGAALAAYEQAQARFDALGGYRVAHRVDELLARLGLDHIPEATPVERLSGGEQTRLGLAAVLLAGADLLLLDEPTNHLDIDALEWLEAFLADFSGAALIVSHDRTFLDRTVTQVLDLDDLTHTLTVYHGTYSDFAEQKAAEIERQWEQWKDEQAEIRRMKQDIHRTRMQAKSVELTTTPRQPGVRRYAKKVAKKAEAREKKLDRYLESEDRVDKPEQRWQMKLDFGEMPRGGSEVLRLKAVGGHYPGSDWLFTDVTLTLLHGERIALLGPNGSGKSTLLKMIVGEMAPAAGVIEIGANVRVGYMPQKQDTLPPDGTPLSVIRRARPITETEARNFLHFFLFAGDEVFVPVGKLSYGERSRLLLATLVAQGANCLLLDEPVNHLDIPSRERFEDALDAFPGAILATVHDRAFIDRFATGVWSLEDRTVRRYIDRAEMLKMRGR